MSLSTFAAMARFGLGCREGTLAAAGSDPRGYLEAELARRDASINLKPPLPDGATALVTHNTIAQQLREARATLPPTGAMAPAADAVKPMRNFGYLFQDEVVARIEHLTAGASTEAGFVERLVWFWSNHFAVSALKGGPVTVLAGPYEREAIRPHVFGRFADMLVAVEKHPAMLLYLDNVNSLGPNSPAGRNRRRGLNENLAREILELHTLGADGGYSQADVTSFARLITGWTVARIDARRGEPGHFYFNPDWHERGAHRVLGVAYEGDGDESGGVAALRDLARRPATARHVASKLARHFVSDLPPPALVDRLAKTFLNTDGDLYALALALLRSPEAWTGERSKLRSPREFIVAAMRLPGGFSADKRPNAFLSYLATLGEPLWRPPAPNGFPDAFENWASPEGLAKRLDVAARLASRVQTDHRDVLKVAFGSEAEVSQETRRTLAGAESRQQAAAILLMSPEFQRR